eukprot:snap_masked-scaffold_17-processed-gene-4.27-mRNA-1 protein AED:1.00 eAED:1.00 QI:0/0/0/0/1/1/2/0/408
MEDSLALLLIAIPCLIHPKVVFLLFFIIFFASFKVQEHTSTLSTTLNSGQAVQTLFSNFLSTLEKEPIYPGLTDYFGWNYEPAVALQALRFSTSLPGNSSDSLTSLIETVLEESAEFPQAGYWMRSSLPVFWLYSSGDRIGLYGSLYKDIHQNIFSRAISGTFEWPSLKSTGLKMRNVGIGPFLGFSFRKEWIWSDDVYMAGASLLEDRSESNRDEVRRMLMSVDEVLRDAESGLFFHGVKMDGMKVVDTNRQIWGRANGWIMLTFGLYVHYYPDDEEIRDVLKEKLSHYMTFQNPNGSFKNILDKKDTSDEVSFGSSFIFSVSVAVEAFEVVDDVLQTLVNSAELAYNWINDRRVQGLSMSDTCGKAPLSKEASLYESRTTGLQEGPALAFVLWARNGAISLGFLDP